MYERARAAAPDVIAGGGVRVDRGEYDTRLPGELHKLARKGDAIAVRKIDVDEGRCGLDLNCGRQRRRNAVSLADHRYANGREQASGQAPKRRIVVDNQHRSGHAQTMILVPRLLPGRENRKNAGGPR